MSKKMFQLVRVTALVLAIAALVACATPTSVPPTVVPTKAPVSSSSSSVASVSSSASSVTSSVAPTALPTATKPPASPTPVPGPEALTLPIVKEPVSISYWAAMNTAPAAVLKSYGDMAAYKELEKRTGIHIDFQHPPTGQGTEQFNLIVASGKYPDVIETNWLSAAGGPSKYMSDKVIIKLNAYIDKYAPNLTKLFKDRPELKRMLQTDEGEIYCFPFVRSVPSMITTGPALRKDWLDKLGLKTPETIDEWYTVLKAFKEKDPNGNGKADEVAFSPYVSPDSTNAYRGAWNNYAFIGAWGIGMNWYQEKGVVKYGPLQPEYKEFLKGMAQWYKEGLIDPDFFSAKKSIVDAKFTGNQLGSAVMLVGGGIGTYIDLMAPKDPTFKIVAAPYPVLKKGDKPIMGQMDFAYPGEGCAAITTANKRVVETVKMLDYAYSTDGAMLFNFGIEGVSYKMVNGYPTYTEEITKNPKNLPMNQAMALYMRSNFNGPFVQDPRYDEQYKGKPEQIEAAKIWSQPANEKHMPPITLTADESKKYANIMSDIDTLYNETFSKTISGQLSVDKWDDFVKQLKSMGIDDAIKLRQTALDRYNKRP